MHDQRKEVCPSSIHALKERCILATVYAVLNNRIVHLQVCDPQLDTYWKISGFTKYWDGYDNQPVVFIDDPVMPDIKVSKDDVQGLKMVLSNGPCPVEIKYGAMQFDSKLATNQASDVIAYRSGGDNSEAIRRHMVDTVGSYNLISQTKAQVVPLLILKGLIECNVLSRARAMEIYASFIVDKQHECPEDWPQFEILDTLKK